ncbi:LAFA_0E11672g1_1 [Lachancea sp. 'fantastica']|nr:LAFA_0E11672g1_1 [Lachancea sp. 'fantastica']
MILGVLKLGIHSSVKSFPSGNPSRLVYSGILSKIRHLRCYSSSDQSKTPEVPKPPNNLDRVHKVIAKSRFLRKLNEKPRFKAYFDKLGQTSPVSTITSFLILHEITAIVPLFALWWVLYKLNLEEQYNLPVYFKDLLNQCGDSIQKLVDNYDEGFDRNRLVLSGAISYAVVKILYPIRVLISLWAAPFFFKWIIAPFQKVGKLFKKPPTKTSDS